jgi:hypothetical protein
LEKSYKQVKKNAGGAGVDGMSVKEFGEWFAKLAGSSNGITTGNLLSTGRTGNTNPQAQRRF